MAKKVSKRRAKKAAPAESGKIDTGRYKYSTLKVRDAAGKVRHSRGNGDSVARAMLAFTAAGGTIDKVIKANKLGDKMGPHADKNAGHQRMILGHALRALIRAGTPVVIGDVTVKSLEQRVAVPDQVKDVKISRKKAAA